MQLTQVMTEIPASVGVTTASRQVDCAQMNKVCFQVTSTGTASFAATIQKSNDGINWVDTAGTAPIAAPGTVMPEVSNFTARYCRLNLVFTSGTLTNTVVIFNGKF